MTLLSTARVTSFAPPQCFVTDLTSLAILQAINSMLFSGNVIKGGLYHAGGEAIFAVLRSDTENVLSKIIKDLDEYQRINNMYYAHVDSTDWIGLSYLIEQSKRTIQFNRNRGRFEFGAPYIHTKFL